jgi:sugar phosphate isomerase/epimerase
MRKHALDFVSALIDVGGDQGAPAIIGSMQGRWGGGVNHEEAFVLLCEALIVLGEHARRHGVPLIYEPLNRYETNLFNTLEGGVALLESIPGANVKLLADLFHMNIEEADLAAAIRAGGAHIGHVHLADSNRRPAGAGHTDFAPVAAALRDIGYDGYVSAECFPHPDSGVAARMTIDAFNRYFRS